MVYKVIGLMSGSSLDGLDICYAHYEETRGKWAAEIMAVDCVPYNEEWLQHLKSATQIAVPEFLKLNTAYGRYLGEAVLAFMDKHELAHKVHFVASHGHTVFHEPQSQTTFQIGDGASIAAVLGLPVISDLRSADIALGGQGAPIVPIGDRLLFADYDVLINIGGIANMTVRKADGSYVAFDVSVANQALNFLAQKMDKTFDEDGGIAATGQLITEVLIDVAQAEYYQKTAPKSLSNEHAMSLVKSFVEDEQYSVADRLHTLCHFIAEQLTQSLQKAMGKDNLEGKKAIITGGGAFNNFLVQLIQTKFEQLALSVSLPDEKMIAYKEALVMGLIGILRWREETNVLAEVTGAKRDSVGGAFWMGA
jgi:anhydro-N-acetylmuramic acid kinase